MYIKISRLTLYLEGGVADLLDQVLHSDGAGLEAQEELLALRPGHQLQVKRVPGQETGDTGGQTGPRRGRSHLGWPGVAPLAP